MANDPFQGLLVLIPTRNRVTLAERAIQSVLAQSQSVFVRVMVSDNSTDASQKERLTAFCKNAGAVVQYVTPPEPCRVGKHWNWLVKRALEEKKFNHFCVLTDRMIFQQGQLEPLARLALQTPDRILSYNIDEISDWSAPVVLSQSAWTGETARLRTSWLLKLVAGGRMHPAFPRLLNCVVPRSIVRAMENQFGDVCDSLAPDYAFGIRACTLTDEILYVDRPVLLSHAQARSKSGAMSRGSPSEESRDFLKSLASAEQPFPLALESGLLTRANLIAHEFNHVRQQAGEGVVPKLDVAAYLKANTEEVALVEDKAQQKVMRRLLAKHGCKTGSSFVESVKGWFGIKKPVSLPEGALSFETTEAAMEHARNQPRARQMTHPMMDALREEL